MEGGPPVVGPGHLKDAFMPLDTLYAQACPKSLTSFQIVHHLVHSNKKAVLLSRGEFVSIVPEAIFFIIARCCGASVPSCIMLIEGIIT